MEIEPFPASGHSSEPRLYFGMASDGTGGCYLAIRSSSLYLYDRNSSGVREEVPLAYPIEDAQGLYRVSLYEGQLAVWANDQLIHVFDIGDPADDTFALFPGTDMKLEAYFLSGTAYQGPFKFRWYRLDDRFDNFVMDMGGRGAQLLSKLIGEKRIYFRDGSGREVLIYRDRDLVATQAAPSSLAVQFGEASSDTELKTRALIEGAHVVEILDKESMRDKGNLFALINSTELNSKSALTDEAYAAIADVQARGSIRNMAGAADLRIEPGDVVWVRFDTETLKMLVSALSIAMSFEEDGATYDMDAGGVVYYEVANAKLLVSDNTLSSGLGGNIV